MKRLMLWRDVKKSKKTKKRPPIHSFNLIGQKVSDHNREVLNQVVVNNR